MEIREIDLSPYEPSWIPGLAHLRLGHPGLAMLWFTLTLWLYLFLIVPGLICNILCVADARRIEREARAAKIDWVALSMALFPPKKVKKTKFDQRRLLLSSPLARRILKYCQSIRADLHLEDRKIWPVARVARIFGVSERLLWYWIKAGLLKTQKPGPDSARKKGIARSAVVRLLNLLEKDAWLFEMNDGAFRSAAGRPSTAVQKIRKAQAWRNPVGGLTPGEFASQAGVSRTSVIRAIREGALPVWQPTPCRYLIGRRPRKKVKK